MVNWPQVNEDLNRGYNQCFGCGKDNPVGLKLEFKWDGKYAHADFTPREIYQGWNGYLHGGIIACILDEALIYAAVLSGTKSITARLQVQLKKLVPITETLVITSWVNSASRRLVETGAKIELKDGSLAAEGTSTQFIVKDEGGAR